MAYNPHFNARTLRVHIERLRTHRWVWWGRFSADTERLAEPSVRARWPHVAELADARRTSKEPTLLFVTNHNDLHVYKVSEILLGDDPPGGVRRAALPYYADHSVPMWFRVVEARALSYDQTVTLDWYRRRLGVVRGGATRANGDAYTQPYDPYASALYRYPIVIDAPTCASLFDDDPPPGGKGRWADREDAITSRPVQRARDTLAKEMGRTWARLDEVSKEALANASVLKGFIDRGDDIDPAAAYTRLAIAYEEELRQLVPEIDALARRLKKARPAIHKRLVEELAAARPNDANGISVPWSLGPSLRLLRRLEQQCKRDMTTLGLGTLVALCENRKAFEDVKRLRDGGVHPEDVAKSEHRRALARFFEKKGEPIAPIMDAREAVARAAR